MRVATSSRVRRETRDDIRKCSRKYPKNRYHSPERESPHVRQPDDLPALCAAVLVPVLLGVQRISGLVDVSKLDGLAHLECARIGLLLTSSTRVPIGAIQPFSNANDVSDYFGPTSAEASLGAIYFQGFTNSNTKPSRVLFTQYPTASVAAWLRTACPQPAAMRPRPPPMR